MFIASLAHGQVHGFWCYGQVMFIASLAHGQVHGCWRYGQVTPFI
jgi:hypothetical protein